MNWTLQYLMPQHLLSHLAGKLARCEIKWIKNLLIASFAKHYQISLDDALEKNRGNYPSLESFFIRKVDPNARSFTAEEDVVSCPADGKISQIGEIAADQIIQAKGCTFRLDAFLGGLQEAKNFYNGNFATIYLAPKDYHRVYAPTTATLQKIIYIPGKLFSVNQKTSCRVPNLYVRNERSILIFQKGNLTFAAILVGAMIVAGIKTAWQKEDPDQVIDNKIQIWNFDKKNINVSKGDEIGFFTFGSTVILLFPQNSVDWKETVLDLNRSVQIGLDLGKIKNL